MKKQETARKWRAFDNKTGKTKIFNTWEAAHAFKVENQWSNTEPVLVGPKFRGKVRTVDVNALRWWDKVNGNTYFASVVTINDGLPNETRLYMPFQYGYGDQYEYEAAAVLRLAGIICKDGFENSLWRMRETLGFILRANIRDAKKSGLTAISKMLANLGRDF